jgi:PAS domain S-box-containing protein
VRDAGFRALITVPVEDARQPERNALVLVFFEQPRTFSDEDLELSRHLADAARGALERSALYEAERSARSLAQQLSRTGALLATELDPAGVLDEVVEQAPALIGADACTIRVLEGEDLVVSAAGGPGAEATLGSRSPSTARLSGDVFHSRAPVAVTDVAGDERLVEADPLLGLGYSSYLGVPLVAPEGGIHGVLSVYARTPRAWRADEIEALLALAGNASSALSNAELYQRVASEKQRSDAILANIADGIVAVDRDGRVVLWNAAAEQITGVPEEEALGRTPEQVLRRNLASDGESPLGNRHVAIQRGGKDVWLSLTEAVMRDPLGAVSGRIYAFRDISADRFVEQMKSEFVSTVSHELRRPLTSIYGFAETLLRRDVLFGEEERRTFLGYIASESERLTAIVDALLNVARVDAGDLQVNLRPTDVAGVVHDVVGSVQQSAGANEHRFVVDVPAEPLAAEADAEKLRLVLGNLVDNAIKYSPNGGTVTVAARRRRDTVEVTVADEGIGIPLEEQQRIFRKFYRGDATGRGSGGTGVGLFLAQGWVTAMGGRIWVTSAEGEGASFTFALPASHRKAGAVDGER